MRRWYEWTVENHDKSQQHGPWVTMNVREHTQFLRNWIDTGKLAVTEMAGMRRNIVIQEILSNYPDLDPDTITEWIMDPEYDRLMESTQGRIFLHEKFHDYLIKNLQPAFDIDWTSAVAEITVQRPGEMFPLHHDRLKHSQFGLPADMEHRIQRWLIMLYDQQPGQCFFMDNQSVTWQAGDVIHWPRINVAHGSANFGYWPRYSLLLTGVVNDAVQ